MAEINAQSELASIVRTLVVEGGDSVKALLRAAMASPLIAFVLSMIITEIAEKKLNLIDGTTGGLIKGGLVAFVGVDVLEGVEGILPFKASSNTNSLGPTSLTLIEAAKIVEAAKIESEMLSKVSKLEGLSASTEQAAREAAAKARASPVA